MIYPVGIQNFEEIRKGGYLTIKDYDEEFNTYVLGFPNKEVEQGFVNFLLPAR